MIISDDYTFKSIRVYAKESMLLFDTKIFVLSQLNQ